MMVMVHRFDLWLFVSYEMNKVEKDMKTNLKPIFEIRTYDFSLI